MYVPREEIAKLHFQWSCTVDFFPPAFTDCSANAQQLSMKGRLLKKSSQMLIFIYPNVLDR